MRLCPARRFKNQSDLRCGYKLVFHAATSTGIRLFVDYTSETYEKMCHCDHVDKVLGISFIDDALDNVDHEGRREKNYRNKFASQTPLTFCQVRGVS